MKSLRDPEVVKEMTARVERITPDNRRRWGKMELGTMIAHISDQFRMAVGEVAVKKVSGPFRFAPTRHLMLHVLPWPKGKAQAPEEAFTTRPTSIEADRATLVSLIHRFADTPASELKPLHPLFGTMSERDWGVLSYRHLDHHLRQFGA